MKDMDNIITDIPKIMQHFIDSQKMIRDENNEKFAEDEGRIRDALYAFF